VNAVELERVARDFRSGFRRAPVHALTDISFGIPEGEIVGLLGPNGSGKTTLLKIILGLLAPTAGSCRVLGMCGDCSEVRSMVGYLPESPELYPCLTGTELVRFFAGLAGLTGAVRENRVREVIARVGMENASGRRVDTYSRGMKQRIGLAQALVAEPKLVILDEPTANLDPEGVAEIGQIIRGIQMRGGTVLLSSHQLDEIEDLCSRVVILDRGRLAAAGSLEELVRPYNRDALIVESLPRTEHLALDRWLTDRGARLQFGRPPQQNGLKQLYLAAANSRISAQSRVR
jgi:ABC-2 type transport system ATP-binding protein